MDPSPIAGCVLIAATARVALPLYLLWVPLTREVRVL
jgi:hypothetical protein